MGALGWLRNLGFAASAIIFGRPKAVQLTLQVRRSRAFTLGSQGAVGVTGYAGVGVRGAVRRSRDLTVGSKRAVNLELGL